MWFVYTDDPPRLSRRERELDWLIWWALNAQVLRWQIISTFDILIEVALFGMSILLVKDLKMRLRRKAFVIAAFALRLPYAAHLSVFPHLLTLLY